MSEIILDFGSGNTCRNDTAYVKRMIDELKAVDTGRHRVVIKWQLFKEALPNIPLEHQVFDYAYKYAKEQGYQTTSSVNDLGSLEFLLRYEIPFVKIANRRELDWLIGEVPRKIPVYVSVGKIFDNSRCPIIPGFADFPHNNLELCCISEYPAEVKSYVNSFSRYHLTVGISDHTIGFDLWREYKPVFWECHYRLEDSTGLDAGPFAKTPKELRQIL